MDISLPRQATVKLNHLLLMTEEHPNVILVEGPRQVGKTTVVEQCLEQGKLPHVSFNLEKDLRHKAAIDRCTDFNDFSDWLADEFQFKPDGSKILFIDEAQESRKLGSFVRSMKEEWKNTKVILTGSMMSRLFRDDIRYPVGRVTTLAIQPFSFFEFLEAWGKTDWIDQLKTGEKISSSRHQHLLEALNTYLHIGGLPRVVIDFLNEKEATPTLTEIFENYRNDFIRVFGEDQGYLFEKTLQAVADHVGSPSKFSQALLPNDPSYRKVASVYSRLEAWRMIYTSLQRGPQPEGTTQYHPKRYLFDMGLLNFLRTLGVPPIDVLTTSEAIHRQTLGGIFENMAAFYMVHWDQRLTGWKKAPAGMEVDFIARFGEKTIPIECKAALKTKESHLTGLKKYMQEYTLDVGVVVNAAPFEKRTFPFGAIFACPLYAVEALPEILAGTQ